MATSIEKGNELEMAVHAIETLILKSSPAFRENTFKIENKKLVMAEGVRHEIDVFVEVDLGPGYRAVFIFECKNWQDAVGKNEIIVFAEKIDALQAQRGFFVAKSFSRDALAQAKKDARIELLIATDLKIAETPTPFDFHTIAFEKDERTVAEVTLQQRGTEGISGPVIPLDIPSAAVTFDGCEINLQKFLDDWFDAVVNEDLSHFPSATLPEGTYERTTEATRDFGPNQLLVDGREMSSISLRISFPVRVIRPAIISYYEVATRGRRISFAPLKIGDGILQYALTMARAAGARGTPSES